MPPTIALAALTTPLPSFPWEKSFFQSLSHTSFPSPAALSSNTSPCSNAAQTSATVQQHGQGGHRDHGEHEQVSEQSAKNGGDKPDPPILLTDKVIPVCDLPEARRLSVPIVRNHGKVNLKPLADFISGSKDEIWTDEYQARVNVGMKRPAHDRWGIGKIVFCFCDDYMQKCVRFPWWFKWGHLLRPIFDGIGIPMHRVLRALLAKMPPGVEIPTHHDTGLWVKHTHRLHVAVQTNPEVEFKVGRAPDEMNRVLFPFGQAIELNNQAEHYVKNGGDEYRIHFIFDYVDDDETIPPTIECRSPTEIFQTRRSLDVIGDPLRFQIPQFVLIGAQKAGSTALYNYMIQHPLAIGANSKETHALDWFWNRGKVKAGSLRWDYEPGNQHRLGISLAGADVEGLRAQYQTVFNTEHLLQRPSIMTGEATPGYLLGGRLIARRLRALAPHTKLLVIVRDPTSRAHSQYNMSLDTNGTKVQLARRAKSDAFGKSLEEVVDADLEALRKAGVVWPVTSDSSSSQFGTLSNDQLDALEFAFEKYIRRRARPLTHGGHSYVGRGLYALQLRAWLREFPRESLCIVRLEDMKSKAGAQEVLTKCFHHVGLPDFQIATRKELENRRTYAPMPAHVRTKLEAFYAPFNALLEDLVGQQM